MIPTRAALALPAAVLVLSGCGVAASHAPRTTTDALHLTATAPAIAATALLRPLPLIPAAPTYVVANIGAGGANEWVEILTPSGKIVARTEINPTWAPVAGAGGAYWTENGAEYELTPAGAVRKLGLVPNGANGVVIGPDGTSYAYATSAPLPSNAANPLFVNKIMVIRAGLPAKVVGDVVGSANDVYSEGSGGWSYSLVSWTDAGIGFVRSPQGMCGCGSFDFQMQSGYSAIIDPVSGGETTLTANTSCPLSDLGPALESVCFDTNANTGATDQIRIATAGTVTHTYTLSGKNAAGDAMFSADGSQLGYVTIPVAQADECGGSDFTVTLHMMDIATGYTVDREMGNFTPTAWSGGAIFGSIASADGNTSYLVAVNPTTFAVTQLTPSGDTAQTIGVM
jgi:hypothetical protein